MLIPLTALRVDPLNARTVRPDNAADAGLIASIRLLGVLQPILVRPAPGGEGWSVVAGARRAAAARVAGLEAIDAVEAPPDADALAISAAENMVRARMHPVDQWKALRQLIERGMTIHTAADALGIDHALARRLAWLGAMDATTLDALALDHDLPPGPMLRMIAMAPHAVQARAVATALGQRSREDDPVDWNHVASMCRCDRVPRARAIFDPGLMHWDEDLFAEPGSDEQFTTSEVGRFLELQRAELARQAAASQGRMTVLPWETGGYRLVLPKGWRGLPADPPKRWRKGDPRHVFAAVVTTGHAIGAVLHQLAEPQARAHADADERSPRGAAQRPAAAAPAERPAIQKATQDRLADLKADGVRHALRVIAEDGRPEDMLRALLCVFLFRDTAIRDNKASRDYFGPNQPFPDVAAALFDEDGQPRGLGVTDLMRLAADALGRAVEFESPGHYRSNGPAAEWLATLVGAKLPRCDTPDILRGIGGGLLLSAAQFGGFAPAATLTALRKKLAGHLEGWAPVAYGAPRPALPAPATEPDEDDDAIGDAEGASEEVA